MSARALLNDLRLTEVPMQYEERIGRSKLRVLRDGVRFLQAIFSGALCYRPEKLLLTMFMLCLASLALLAAYPVEFYFQNGRLEEWMIYRFVVCYLLGSFGLMLLLATALVYQMAAFGPRRGSANAFWPFVVAGIMRGHALAVILVSFLVLAGVFLWPGIIEYGATGHVTLHWSRLLAGAFSLFSGLQTAVFALLLKVLSVWRGQQTHSESIRQTARKANLEIAAAAQQNMADGGCACLPPPSAILVYEWLGWQFNCHPNTSSAHGVCGLRYFRFRQA